MDHPQLSLTCAWIAHGVPLSVLHRNAFHDNGLGECLSSALRATASHLADGDSSEVGWNTASFGPVPPFGRFAGAWRSVYGIDSLPLTPCIAALTTRPTVVARSVRWNRDRREAPERLWLAWCEVSRQRVAATRSRGHRGGSHALGERQRTEALGDRW